MNWIRTGLLCVAAVAPLFAGTIVAPGAFASTEGPSNSSVPFTWEANLRSQTVYNASLFSALTGPVWITGVNYRLDSTLDGTFSQTLPNFQLTMATTSRAAGNLSTTFADNPGPDATVVRSGSLTINHTAGSGPGPRPFNVSVSFQTPFLYDPSAGNLLFDYLVTGNTSRPNVFYDGTYNFSQGATSSNGISTILTDRPNQATAAPLSCCPASDGTSPGGLIVQLVYNDASAVPEPATLSLTGAAGLAALLSRRRLARQSEARSAIAERALLRRALDDSGSQAEQPPHPIAETLGRRGA